MVSAVGRHYEARLAAESRDRRPVDGLGWGLSGDRRCNGVVSAVGRHYEARLAAESRDRRPVDGVSGAWVGLCG